MRRERRRRHVRGWKLWSGIGGGQSNQCDESESQLHCEYIKVYELIDMMSIIQLFSG